MGSMPFGCSQLGVGGDVDLAKKFGDAPLCHNKFVPPQIEASKRPIIERPWVWWSAFFLYLIICAICSAFDVHVTYHIIYIYLLFFV